MLTRAQVATDALQDAILSGRIAAGAPIRLEPTAQALNMSPSPVREAIRELVRLGLVVQVPHKGAHVAELSVEDLLDTYRVRLVLETKAIRLAAARFTNDDATRASPFLAAYGAALESSAMREARASHSALHFTLYGASGSTWLMRLIQPAWENSERYRFMTAASVETLRSRHAEHYAILAACVERDSERAAQLLTDHLVATVERVAAQMGAGSVEGLKSGLDI